MQESLGSNLPGRDSGASQASDGRLEVALVHRRGLEHNRASGAPLIYYHAVDKGGHFAAWEQPELFSGEIQAAFRSLHWFTNLLAVPPRIDARRAKQG